MNTFVRFFVLLFLFCVSASVAFAEVTPKPIMVNAQSWDKNGFHVVEHASETPAIDLGLVGDRLLVTFSADQHAWFFNHAFVPVVGEDPAKALGYPTWQKADGLVTKPTKNQCTGLKDVVAAVVINKQKSFCLTASQGGDYTLYLMPKKKKFEVGFGKKFLLSKEGLTWIGYDGSVYQALMHPDVYQDDVVAMKTKNSSVVYLVKNGMKFQIPDEKTFFSWFRAWKDVKVVDAKVLAKNKTIDRISFKPNSLIKFAGESTIYIYQPKNDLNFQYGKDVTITKEGKDGWEIKQGKNKTSEKVAKRKEVLRPVESVQDLIDLYGPNWQKRLIELETNKKSTFTIQEKTFDAKTEVVTE